MCYHIFVWFKRLSIYYFVASVTVNISQKCYMIFKSMNRHNSKCIDKWFLQKCRNITMHQFHGKLNLSYSVWIWLRPTCVWNRQTNFYIDNHIHAVTMIDVMYVMLRTLIGSILRNTLYFEHLFHYKYSSLHNRQRDVRLILT